MERRVGLRGEQNLPDLMEHTLSWVIAFVVARV